MTLRSQAIGRAAVVAAVALALDQISKALVRSEIAPGERIDLILGVDLVRVSNDGIAFGLFSEAGSLAIALAAGAFTLLIAYFLLAADRPELWLPLGLLTGGALGNLTDRVTEGSVTDFIDPPGWPAFNLADVEITLGVIVLLLLYLREPGADEQPPSEPADEPETGGAQGPAK